MKRVFAIVATVGIFAACGSSTVAEPAATLHVQAGQVTGKISPYTLGACIEDVNHEIYGGLYSQMVFGESFQEPAPTTAPPGFTAYGGNWIAGDNTGELAAAAGAGPKLLADSPANFDSGEVRVEVQFTDKTAGNAGLIVRVREAGVGADKFTGYEISLYPDTGRVILGRHRQNWEPLVDVPCPVPLDEWIPLAVKLDGNNIEVAVDGQQRIKFDDTEHPLPAGQIGLRTWQRGASFRNLQTQAGGQTTSIPLRGASANDQVSGMWRPVHRANRQRCAMFSLCTDGPFVGSQCQRIETLGNDEPGVENQGLNRQGMYFAGGQPYEGVIWARASKPVTLRVAFESADGSQTVVSTTLQVDQPKWQRLEFQLTPDATCQRGRLAITLERGHTVDLGFVSLQPGAWGRFKGLPVRKDVADTLVAQGLSVLRYGGSMINDPEYRWKKMIGPRDRRAPYQGTWYSQSTNGWGIIDFLSFCEAAGFLGIPDFNIDESPQDMADFVEYVNGSPESQWGKQRVADGHPAPFKLKYIQLGNEEAVNEAYWQKFKLLAEAIWRADPSITPVVGDFAYGEHIADPYDFPGAPSIKSLAAHKKILDFAHSQNRPVWFDVHIWNDAPRDCDKQLVVLGELIDWLGKLSPQADFKVCVFEENANNHLLRRGLAHARTVNGLQRFGSRVPIVCAANCLQVDGQNDNGWDQGLLFLSPAKVWAQPSYYVTQMISRSNLPILVKVDCESPAGALDAVARLSENGAVLALQVVNVDNRPLDTLLRIDGFEPASKVGKVSQIAGQLDDGNTADNPERIVPREIQWQLPDAPESRRYLFPPQSFTVLRFE